MKKVDVQRKLTVRREVRAKATEGLTLEELQRVTPEQIRALPELISVLNSHERLVEALREARLIVDAAMQSWIPGAGDSFRRIDALLKELDK